MELIRGRLPINRFLYDSRYLETLLSILLINSSFGVKFILLSKIQNALNLLFPPLLDLLKRS